MTDTTRNLDDLVTNLFQDGQPDLSITEGRVRDLAQSAFSVYTTIKTATYTAALVDRGTTVCMNVASANSFQVPTNASVAFPIGTVVKIRQVGAGATTIVAVTPGTTTLVSSVNPGLASFIAGAVGSTIILTKHAIDTWYVDGDLQLPISVGGTTYRSLQYRFSRSLSFHDWGVVADGVVDDRAAIQAAMTYCAANGRTLHGRSGTHLLGSALRIPSGLRLYMDRDCILQRGYTAGGTNGMLMNASMTVKVNDVIIEGGTLKNTDTTTFLGNQVCLNGDDIHIRNMRFDEWGDTSRAMLLYGDRMRLQGLWGKSAGQGGGIRYAGGTDFICSDTYFECGDDAYNLVPSGAGAALFDQSISRAQYVNCVGYSFNGRLFLATMTSGGVLDMAGSITDCAFIGIRGKAGNRAFVVQNIDSVGTISRIDIVGCMVDCGTDVTSGNAAYIFGDVGTGGVSDVRMSGLTLLSPYQECMEASGVVDRVYAEKCYFDAPRTPDVRTIDYNSVTNGSFRDCAIVANGANSGLCLGNVSAVRNVEVSGCTFENIDNSYAGLTIDAGTSVSLRNNRFVERSGQTSAFAIALLSSAVGTTIDNQDYSGITRADKVSIGTTNRPRFSNPALTLDAAGSTLQNYNSGATYYNTGATAITPYVLSSAVPSIEYKFIVTDADGIRVTANTGETIRDVGTVSATGGKIESTTVGSTLHIRAMSATEWYVVGKTGTWTVT
jgi:hypothetical protein